MEIVQVHAVAGGGDFGDLPIRPKCSRAACGGRKGQARLTRLRDANVPYRQALVP